MTEGKKRRGLASRETKETRITVDLILEGSGQARVRTPYGFMNHMLTAFARHSLFDLKVTAKGDVEVDAHHLMEDLGLVMGLALGRALGLKQGIRRFGEARAPMDESLASAAVDLSGRFYLVYDVIIPQRKQWEFDCNLAKEFFQAFAGAGLMNLHLRLEYGDNYHHALESLFKAAGLALRQAVERDPRVKGVPSSKGSLK